MATALFPIGLGTLVFFFFFFLLCKVFFPQKRSKFTVHPFSWDDYHLILFSDIGLLVEFLFL